MTSLEVYPAQIHVMLLIALILHWSLALHRLKKMRKKSTIHYRSCKTGTVNFAQRLTWLDESRVQGHLKVLCHMEERIHGGWEACAEWGVWSLERTLKPILGKGSTWHQTRKEVWRSHIGGSQPPAPNRRKHPTAAIESRLLFRGMCNNVQGKTMEGLSNCENAVHALTYNHVVV